jgi:RNA polymerase sigma-70 factor (TIGR02957 family)
MGGDPTEDSAAAHIFAEHRSLLFTVAYEITGSVADAEDVVQDSYLRWAGVDPSQVLLPRAYLAKIAARLAINKLRSAARRREDYIGPWLPEPVLTSPDIADDVVLADSVSMAMLVVLETLTPHQRAVFVLHEVFGFSHQEIAEAVSKTEPAVRQILHRARQQVLERRPARAGSATGPEKDAVLQRFLTAASTGDLQGLMDVLAPDVVLISDGGGIKSAALRPILGADKTARFLVGVGANKIDGELRVEPAWYNSSPASVVYIGGEADSVGTIEVVDDRIVAIYLVRNPEKFTGLDTPRVLSR